MPKGMTPKKRMKQRRTKPLRKVLKGLAPLVKGKKTTGRQELKDMMKNIKARRKAGATDSSSRLKLETAYTRAKSRKPSGRLNASDLKSAGSSTFAQRRKKLTGIEVFVM